MKKLMTSVTLAALVPTLGFAENAMDNKEIAIEALNEMLVELNVEAVNKYIGSEYIQHNPMVPDGAEALKGLITQLAANKDENPFSAEYVRVIADDDMVAFHTRYEGFGDQPLVGFDVFRLEDGKIVEHWDNLTPETEPNPSGHTQLDGETEIVDLDKTEENKAKVEEFITRSLINHEEVDITQYISPETYIQHNSMVADGLEGFGAFMAEMAEKGISMEYNEVHQVIGEGNFVLTMSEGSMGDEAQAFYDLFRLEDGLIVEHWDVISPMPEPDLPTNTSGKF